MMLLTADPTWVDVERVTGSLPVQVFEAAETVEGSQINKYRAVEQGQGARCSQRYQM